MITPIVELTGAGKVYRADGRGTVGVEDVDLKIEPGTLTLLLGPSGSGKTTLLTLMAGLVAPSSGSVVIEGHRIDQLPLSSLQRLRARSIGFVFQTFNLIDALTARENVALTLRFAGIGRRESLRRAEQILGEIGIAHLGSQFTSELSQGEKQRVAFARAIANNPVLLLADEPTASLDSEHGLEIIDLLHRYAQTSLAGVVVATHDLRTTDWADRIVRLKDGRIEGIEETEAAGRRYSVAR
jgi:putative ABC transport system ATP-binding protein